MTNQEILTKAIQKATKAAGLIQLKDGSILLPDKEYHFDKVPYGLIFNHEFAKALWGDKKIDDTKSCFDAGIRKGDLRVYQYHLILMVLADDPIKYLGENI